MLDGHPASRTTNSLEIHFHHSPKSFHAIGACTSIRIPEIGSVIDSEMMVIEAKLLDIVVGREAITMNNSPWSNVLANEIKKRLLLPILDEPEHTFTLGSAINTEDPLLPDKFTYVILPPCHHTLVDLNDMSDPTQNNIIQIQRMNDGITKVLIPLYSCFVINPNLLNRTAHGCE